jgi:hypothetical protein
MIDESFLKHPRKRGHRFRLHWKHYFRKRAIERALELDGDYVKYRYKREWRWADDDTGESV